MKLENRNSGGADAAGDGCDGCDGCDGRVWH
jgi:hypothetical protein